MQIRQVPGLGQSAQHVISSLYRVKGTITSGGLPATGAAVLVTLTHAGVTAVPLLAICGSTGAWNVDLQQARNPLTGAVVPWLAGDTLRVLALLSESQTNTVYPVIVTGASPQQVGTTSLVTGVDSPPPGDPAAHPERLSLGPVSPLPARRQVTLTFRLAAPAQLEVRIVDALGRTVRALASGRADAGTHLVMWDGRTAAGREAPSGIYYAVVTAAGERRTARVVLAR